MSEADGYDGPALIRIAKQRAGEHIRKMRQSICGHRGHVWECDSLNSAKRTCERCGRHEWMFHLRYPSETEPSIQWQHMASGDRR
jgi:hypothetical protein